MELLYSCYRVEYLTLNLKIPGKSPLSFDDCDNIKNIKLSMNMNIKSNMILNLDQLYTLINS